MDEFDELERIREAKRERLRDRVDGDDSTATADEPIAVEDRSHFGRLLETHRTVLVDFYADWCGPCQMLAPILGTIAAETPATVAKVDTDAHQRIAQEHGVRGLPTLALFVDGEPADRLVGMQDEATIRRTIERHRPEAA